jgi:hypothetical protein
LNSYTAYFSLPPLTLAAHLQQSTGIAEDAGTVLQKLGKEQVIACLKWLTLFYEYEKGQPDIHGRFDENVEVGDLTIPLVNKAIATAGLHLTATDDFKVIFTHDIDWVTPLQPVSVLKSVYYKLKGIKYWLDLSQVFNNSLFHDTVSRMLRIEKASGIAATYFMMSGPAGYGKHDTRYGILEAAARKMIRIIHEGGGKTGLHGSYEAREKDTYAKEKSAIETATAQPVHAQRNHYLRFHPARQGEQLEKAGILYDFSIGFTSKAGFRSRICTPYKLIDVQAQRVTGTLEIPLLLMDRLNYLEGDFVNTTYPLLLEQVKQYHGTVSVLTHPENFVFIPEFWDFYESLIRGCIKLGANVSGNYE